MGRKIKNILLIVLGTIVVVTMIYVIVMQHQSICKEVHVKIDYQGCDTLIKPEDILNYLTLQQIKIKGEQSKDLNLEDIQKKLNQFPYVQENNIVINVSHQAFINITQSKPLFRMYNKSEQELIIDDHGKIQPYSPQVKTPLIIVNGEISNQYKAHQQLNIDTPRTILDHCFKIVEYISNDPFLKAQFEQIYINEHQEIEMIPTYGEHLVLLKDSKSIDQKMKSVKALYKDVFNAKGWNKYKAINLEYENVVIGVKYEIVNEEKD